MASNNVLRSCASKLLNSTESFLPRSGHHPGLHARRLVIFVESQGTSSIIVDRMEQNKTLAGFHNDSSLLPYRRKYGVGDVASTLGDVYSFGVLLLEMFTGKRPTDNMFKDLLNLHTFVKNALPDRVMDIVDPCILLEHKNGSWINDCMVSILTIGVACSSESPRYRMEMGTIVSKLCKIKKNSWVNEG